MVQYLILSMSYLDMAIFQGQDEVESQCTTRYPRAEHLSSIYATYVLINTGWDRMAMETTYPIPRALSEFPCTKIFPAEVWDTTYSSFVTPKV